jgi:uncharacterized protein (DUF1330 family)
MTKRGYWVDVTDPEGYKKYIEAVAAPTAKYGARYLVRAGRYTSHEGPSANRHVIVELDSYETALACYDSPEYQEALKLRLACSIAHFVIVEGA